MSWLKKLFGAEPDTNSLELKEGEPFSETYRETTHASISDQPAQERQIRVFISSTFKDMQDEWDVLVKKVFPQLRKLCEERAVAWTEVDLRWGITLGGRCSVTTKVRWLFRGKKLSFQSYWK